MKIRNSIIRWFLLLTSILAFILTYYISLGNIHLHSFLFWLKLALILLCAIEIIFSFKYNTVKFIFVYRVFLLFSSIMLVASFSFPLQRIPEYYKKISTIRKIHSGQLYNDYYAYDSNDRFTGADLIYRQQRMIYGGPDGHQDVVFYKPSSEHKINGSYYYCGYMYSEDNISEAETFIRGPVDMLPIHENWYSVKVELSP